MVECHPSDDIGEVSDGIITVVKNCPNNDIREVSEQIIDWRHHCSHRNRARTAKNCHRAPIKNRPCQSMQNDVSSRLTRAIFSPLTTVRDITYPRCAELPSESSIARIGFGHTDEGLSPLDSDILAGNNPYTRDSATRVPSGRLPQRSRLSARSWPHSNEMKKWNQATTITRVILYGTNGDL